MTPKQRIRNINMLKKISINPDYSEKLGIEVVYKSSSVKFTESALKENTNKKAHLSTQSAEFDTSDLQTL